MSTIKAATVFFTAFLSFGILAVGTAPMVTEWKIPADLKTLSLPLIEGYVYDFEVDWGDGSPAVQVTSFNDFDKTHVYARPGTYTVTLSGRLEAWSILPDEGYMPTYRLLNVWDLGDMGWKNLSYAFIECDALEYVGVSDGNFLSEVTDMSIMFSSADIVKPDVSNWNTSSVTTMRAMFSLAKMANPDVSSWDTSMVTDTSFMFHHAHSASPDIGNWNVPNLTNIDYMFFGARSAFPNMRRWRVSRALQARGGKMTLTGSGADPRR